MPLNSAKTRLSAAVLFEFRKPETREPLNADWKLIVLNPHRASYRTFRGPRLPHFEDLGNLWQADSATGFQV